MDLPGAWARVRAARLIRIWAVNARGAASKAKWGPSLHPSTEGADCRSAEACQFGSELHNRRLRHIVTYSYGSRGERVGWPVSRLRVGRVKANLAPKRFSSVAKPIPQIASGNHTSTRAASDSSAQARVNSIRAIAAAGKRRSRAASAAGSDAPGSASSKATPGTPGA